MSRFNDVVAARTRAAETILGTAELLALYESVGGRRSELERIRDAGLNAEAANLAQSQGKASGAGATLELLRDMADVQREYVNVMAVVQAVRMDLASTASPDLLKRLDTILANEAQVTVRTIEDGETKKKRRSTSRGQEPLRAEIERDAAALLELDETARAALAERRVDGPRLEALRDRARGLAGKLAERTVKKGAAKGATQEERAAVKAQSEVWAGAYRLLRLAASRNPSFAALVLAGAQNTK